MVKRVNKVCSCPVCANLGLHYSARELTVIFFVAGNEKQERKENNQIRRRVFMWKFRVVDQGEWNLRNYEQGRPRSRGIFLENDSIPDSSTVPD